jgi:hypothetical protein
MKNDFSPQTRELFDQGGYMTDWEDGRNDANALHHIAGRVSDSPYNAAPLNNARNHQPEGRKHLDSIHSHACRKRLLHKTKKYLDEIGYKPTKEDLEFLEKVKIYDII